MDPVNRSAFFNMLGEEAQINPDICYISITPGVLSTGLKWGSAIIVQNIYGASSISVVKPNE